MNGTNLILGLAAGYHYGDVRPFLVSLERTGYAGQIVLFVTDTTRDLDRMREHGARLIRVNRPAQLAEVPYNGLRYFLYRDFLESVNRNYGRILISDVRDVIFQSPPFDYPWPAGFNATLEDESVTIGTCPFNAHWVREHLGPNALAEMADKPVSCSGTSVADHGTMLDYLQKMINRLHPPTTGERMAGYDQGIHNMLVHFGKLEDVTLHGNDGPILTLAQTRGEPPLDANGTVLNQVGAPAVMVHQYDRKPELFKLICSKYADNT